MQLEFSHLDQHLAVAAKGGLLGCFQRQGFCESPMAGGVEFGGNPYGYFQK